MEYCDPIGTPMEIKDKLDLDQNRTLVDATKYRSMIGALMYLTSSRPDIVHATCLYARYQAKPTEKHLKELTDYGFYFNKIPIYCDSKSSIAISCNPVQYSTTKHIIVRYHFMKESMEKGTIELYFVKTDYQLANLFRKALPVDRLWEHTMMKPWKRYCFHKFTMSSCYEKGVTEMQSLEIDDMLRIRLREAGSDEEIFTLVSWIRAFNINEPIYAELCHAFYSTYEFDKVCADDELQTKKIIKFRLGGRAHSLTLLEFARSDEHFNAHDYWLSISREENLGLSRSHTSTIRNLILRVIHKMITYGLCQRTIGYDKIQKNDLWLLSMFDARHQNRVLTEDVVRSLSTQIYYRDLDTITLRDLIDSEGRLIPEDPQPGVPRVGIPRPPRASMQNLYDRMGRIEIRQKAIERGAYNLPSYAQPQYDQYYQQYPPPPQYSPQYQQQQQYDDE
ncbi:hypothetical protein Tco_0925878 [Tanacetum coccineum]|uniref:Reverse transcriptase Ty1/copia-type domain-containing protein n=1 Tax=Tanacetum coccineum TaxID=301880 RepID=A0ABQ5DEE3_9ASTR